MRSAILAAAVAVVAFSVVSAFPAEGASGAIMLVQAAGPKPEAPAPKPAPPPEPKAEAQPPKDAPAGEPSKPTPKPRATASRRDPKVDWRECSWVGKRTIRVLMRDDLIAAEGFLKFYNVFGCPVRYLGQAFGCALGVAEGAPARAVETRIDVCWQDPATQAETAGAPAAGQQQPAPAQKPAAPSKPTPRAAAPAKPKPEPETAYPKR